MKLNRVIDPSLIEIGDTISVVHPRNQGIVTILEGTVDKISYSGGIKYFTTKENATLLAWQTGKHNKRVTLLSRPEKRPLQIQFVTDFLDETKERISYE